MTRALLNPGTGPRRRAGRPWVRHGTAAAVTVLLNAALLVGLAWWSAASERAAERELRTLALNIVATPNVHPVASPPPSPVVATVEPPKPVVPPLPLPPLALVSPLDLAPAAPDTIRLPLPAFTPRAISVPLFSETPLTAPPPTNTAAPWRATRNPVLLRPPDLSLYYPYRARLNDLTGTTRVGLRVDHRGRVARAEIQSSSPAGVFETAALRVAHSLAFQPALDHGQPIPSAVTLTIEWRLPP